MPDFTTILISAIYLFLVLFVIWKVIRETRIPKHERDWTSIWIVLILAFIAPAGLRESAGMSEIDFVPLPLLLLFLLAAIALTLRRRREKPKIP